MPFCVKCGRETSAGQRFCANCGTRTGGGVTGAGLQTIARWWLSLLVGVLGGGLASAPLFLVVFLLTNVGQESPRIYEGIIAILGMIAGIAFVITRSKSFGGVFRSGAVLGLTVSAATTILEAIAKIAVSEPTIDLIQLDHPPFPEAWPNFNMFVYMEAYTLLFTLACVAILAIINRVRPDWDDQVPRARPGRVIRVLTVPAAAILTIRWLAVPVVGWVAIPVLWYLWYRWALRTRAVQADEPALALEAPSASPRQRTRLAPVMIVVAAVLFVLLLLGGYRRHQAAHETRLAAWLNQTRVQVVLHVVQPGKPCTRAIPGLFYPASGRAVFAMKTGSGYVPLSEKGDRGGAQAWFELTRPLSPGTHGEAEERVIASAKELYGIEIRTFAPRSGASIEQEDLVPLDGHRPEECRPSTQAVVSASTDVPVNVNDQEIRPAILAALKADEDDRCADQAQAPSDCRQRFAQSMKYAPITLTPSGNRGFVVELPFPESYCGSGGCGIYVLQQAGAQYVKVLDLDVGAASQFRTLETTTNGYYDLMKTSIQDGSKYRYVWNGAKYVSVETR